MTANKTLHTNRRQAFRFWIVRLYRTLDLLPVFGYGVGR